MAQAANSIYSKIGKYSINSSTKVITFDIGRTMHLADIWSFNGKTVPTYPTTNTEKQVLTIGASGGSLAWEDKTVVSASPTGTSTTDISYVTINGVEYRISPVTTGSVNWGNITGSLSNQSDLQTALDTKSTKSDHFSLIKFEQIHQRNR